MKLIIGLGNPDERYKNNRHNVGQRFVREVSTKYKVQSTKLAKVKLLETDCFMNESGKFVKKTVQKHWPNLTNWANLTNLYIAHDDLDLPLGKFKVQFGVGPKVHYGINSIEEALGTKDFWRVRIGVDRRDPNHRIPGDAYVLQDFTREEMETLEKVFPKIWEELQIKFEI